MGGREQGGGEGYPESDSGPIMPEGSQLLIITEAFVISEREGQGVGGELVREIGPRAWTSTNLFVISAYPHVQAGRLRVWVGKYLADGAPLKPYPFSLARSNTHTTHFGSYRIEHAWDTQG